MAAKVVEKDTSSDFEKDERIIEFKKMKTDIEKKNFFKKHKTFFRDYFLNYESLQRGINNEIVLFNETMVAHGKYKKFLSEGQSKKELYLSSNFLPGETKITCPYVDFTKKGDKGDFFQEGYKSSPVGKFESNFEEIVKQMSNNMLTTKEKHDEAQVIYEKLLKKTTGGVSSNILDETNEELTKIMKEYEAEAIRIGKQHMNDETKIFPLKESIFDVVFDTPLTIDGKNFYKPDPELSAKIMVAIEKGIDKESLNISRKLPDKIDKDYKLVNLMIENGELNSTTDFTQTDGNPILSLNRDQPLLAYMDKSGKVNYESVMGDFSREKIKIIKLRDGAKADDLTNTGGALILNVVYGGGAFEWTDNIDKTVPGYGAIAGPVGTFITALNGILNQSQKIILSAFYNDVLMNNAQGKTYLDVRYDAKFRDDAYFGVFFEVELVDISQKMKDIYKIYTDKLLEKFFSKIKKLKESTRSQCDDVRKKYNRKKDDIKTQGKKMVGEVKSSDSSFTEIMELLGGKMLSMVFYGNDSKKYPVVKGFTPEKTKVEIINNGLLWLPYIDYEKLTTDGFDGSNILFKVATGSIFDPGTEVRATTKYIKDLYEIYLMKYFSMQKILGTKKKFKEGEAYDLLKQMNCKSLTDFSKIVAEINSYYQDNNVFGKSMAIVNNYYSILIEGDDTGDNYLTNVNDQIFSTRALDIIRSSSKGLIATVGRLESSGLSRIDPAAPLPYGGNLDFDYRNYGRLGYVAGFYYSELNRYEKQKQNGDPGISNSDNVNLIMNLFVFESTFGTCDIISPDLTDEGKKKRIKERYDEALRYACRYCIKAYASIRDIKNDAHYYAAYAAVWCIFNSISESVTEGRLVRNKSDPLDEYVTKVAEYYHGIRDDAYDVTNFEAYVGFPGFSTVEDTDRLTNVDGNIHTTFNILQMEYMMGAQLDFGGAGVDREYMVASLYLTPDGSNLHDLSAVAGDPFPTNITRPTNVAGAVHPQTDNGLWPDNTNAQWIQGSPGHALVGAAGLYLSRVRTMKQFLYIFRENNINADAPITRDILASIPLAMPASSVILTQTVPYSTNNPYPGPFDIDFDPSSPNLPPNLDIFKLLRGQKTTRAQFRRAGILLQAPGGGPVLVPGFAGNITPVGSWPQDIPPRPLGFVLPPAGARMTLFELQPAQPTRNTNQEFKTDDNKQYTPPSKSVTDFVMKFFEKCYGTIDQIYKDINLETLKKEPTFIDIELALKYFEPNLYGPNNSEYLNAPIMDGQCMFLKTGEQRKNNFKNYFSNLNGLYDLIENYKTNSRIKERIENKEFIKIPPGFPRYTNKNQLYDLQYIGTDAPLPLSVDSRVIDKKKLKEFINGNGIWLKYITDFLQYLDTDKNNMIDCGNNVSYSIRTVNEKNIFTNTTCDDFKDDGKTSFWVDVERGGTKNTILDYMNLRYSITKKLEDGKKMHQIIEGNEKIFQSLKEDTKKEEKSDYLKEKATDALKFWTSSEDSKKLTLKALKEFGIDKFFGAIDKLGYAKVKDFMSLKKNPYGEMMKKNTPEVKSPEKVGGTLLTKPQPVIPNQMGVPIAQKGGGDEETLFENLSKSLDLNSEERVKLSKSIDYVQKKIYEEYEKKKDKKDKEKKGDKEGEDKEEEDKESEDKDKEEEGKVGEDKKDKKLEEIIKKKIDGIVEGDDGEAKYSDKDIEDIQIEYDRIIDEINIKKIKIRNLTNDLSSYQKTRMTTYDLAKEKIIQDLENNKKEIFRLKKEKESIYNQLKYMKLYVEEEKKRNEIKSKQREEYIRIEKEREIEKLLKIQQELKNIIHNSEKDKLELSSKLYDKKTKKKLKSLNQKILSARENSLALKREDLYGSMEIPITTTKNTKNKKRTLKKKKQKKGKSKSVKKDNKRKNNRKTHKKNKKEEKKSLTKSLKKMIGMKV